MKRVMNIEVTDRALVAQRFAGAWKVDVQAQAERLAFASMEEMTRALTPLRWRLVSILQRDGAMPLRELARRAQSDVHGIHQDVVKLLMLGLIEKDESGNLVVPFDEVRTSVAPL